MIKLPKGFWSARGRRLCRILLLMIFLASITHWGGSVIKEASRGILYPVEVP